MKAISHGDNTYDIFDDSLKVYNKLPAQLYTVNFSKQRGFYLSKHIDMDITESMIYGVHNEKVTKVISSFKKMDRNLGVILSGDKGIGKSLFAKLLSLEIIKSGIPVIIVDSYTPGISSYLDSIEQEVMILFDEFDKTFGEINSDDEKPSPQTSLLSVFDGMSSGKKLFVLTCNKIEGLNTYLINRPGRFHYHFRFEYPSADGIREYLMDKVNEEFYNEIESVVAFSNKVNLNYDCLRSIAFELNCGISFSEAIRDLNIINTDPIKCRVILKYQNGISTTADVHMDLFSSDYITVFTYDNSGENVVDIRFIPSKAVYDDEHGCYVLSDSDIMVTYCRSQFEENIKNTDIESVLIMVNPSKSIHYRV